MISTQKLSTEAAHTNTRSSAATSRMRAARPANRKPKLIMMALPSGAAVPDEAWRLERRLDSRQRAGVITYPTGV